MSVISIRCCCCCCFQSVIDTQLIKSPKFTCYLLCTEMKRVELCNNNVTYIILGWDSSNDPRQQKPWSWGGIIPNGKWSCLCRWNILCRERQKKHQLCILSQRDWISLVYPGWLNLLGKGQRDCNLSPFPWPLSSFQYHWSSQYSFGPIAQPKWLQPQISEDHLHLHWLSWALQGASLGSSS